MIEVSERRPPMMLPAFLPRRFQATVFSLTASSHFGRYWSFIRLMNASRERPAMPVTSLTDICSLPLSVVDLGERLVLRIARAASGALRLLAGLATGTVALLGDGLDGLFRDLGLALGLDGGSGRALRKDADLGRLRERELHGIFRRCVVEDREFLRRLEQPLPELRSHRQALGRSVELRRELTHVLLRLALLLELNVPLIDLLHLR